MTFTDIHKDRCTNVTLKTLSVNLQGLWGCYNTSGTKQIQLAERFMLSYSKLK